MFAVKLPLHSSQMRADVFFFKTEARRALLTHMERVFGRAMCGVVLLTLQSRGKGLEATFTLFEQLKKSFVCGQLLFRQKCLPTDFFVLRA